jgi:triosephosphate isomerase (TIM)
MHLIFNWKQGPASEEIAAQLVALTLRTRNKQDTITLCPPAWYLPTVHAVTLPAGLSVGIQDVALSNTGRATGDMELASVFQFEPAFCIVGHSETRSSRTLHEDEHVIHDQCLLLFEKHITPILCVGYTPAGQTEADAITAQLRTLQDAVAAFPLVPYIVAYEPVSAIGTGTIGDVAHILAVLNTIKSVVPHATLCYGGSVDATTIAMLSRELAIDTFLIGSASIDMDKCAKLLGATSLVDKVVHNKLIW